MDLYNAFIVILIQVSLVFGQKRGSNEATGSGTQFLSEKSYAKLFKERRRDSKDLLNIIENEGAYERKYRLLEGAYNKIMSILEQTQSILQSNKYDPLVDKFPPQDIRVFDAVTVTLENTCLFGELLLHNPDISYRVFESQDEGIAWKDLINWCIKYARSFNDRILDAKSQELLWLVEQEINPEKRTENFINPYRISATETSNNAKKKKKAKKIQRGPRMVTRDEF